MQGAASAAQAPGEAPTNADRLGEAERLVQAGRCAEAYQHLSHDQTQTSTDPRINFLLGQCAAQLGNRAAAVKHFRDVLAVVPDSPRVRAELGKAYLATGELEQARAQLTTVLASNPPAAIRRDILNLLEWTKEAKSWHARFSLGLEYDTNVNVGPDSSTVYLLGIPFELTPESAPRSDHAWRGALSATHLNRVSESFAWQTDASVDITDYRQQSDFDYSQLSLATGPKLRFGARELFLSPIFEYAQLGGHKYTQSIGLAPQIEQEIGHDLLLKLALAFQRRNFDIETGRSGYGTVLLAALRKKLPRGDYVEGLYRHAEEDTKLSFLDNRADVLGLSYFGTLGKSWSWYLEPSVTWVRYDQREVIFDSSRRDRRVAITGHIARSFANDRYALVAEHTYIRNRSNVSLNQYGRKLTMIRFVCAF